MQRRLWSYQTDAFAVVHAEPGLQDIGEARIMRDYDQDVSESRIEALWGRFTYFMPKQERLPLEKASMLRSTSFLRWLFSSSHRSGANA
jgi:hypothetical protein